MLIIWGNSSLVKINPTIILWEKSGLGKKSKPRVKPSKIDMNDFFSLTFFEYKPLKTVKTAAQQKRSANKNKYNMLYHNYLYNKHI